jgi:hypothetical protein
MQDTPEFEFVDTYLQLWENCFPRNLLISDSFGPVLLFPPTNDYMFQFGTQLIYLHYLFFLFVSSSHKCNQLVVMRGKLQ